MNIPVPLHCITLQHIIDDVDAVEGYLAEHSEAERCFPLIIRDIFFISSLNTRWNLHIRTDIPVAKTTLRYLMVLWADNEYDKFVRAGEFGATYLLPYLLAASKTVFPSTMTTELLTDALMRAAANGYTDTVLLLIQMGGQDERYFRGGDEPDVQYAVDEAARHGHIDTTLALIENHSYEMLDPIPHAYRALKTAIVVDNIPLASVILEKYPIPTTDLWYLLFNLPKDISDSPGGIWLSNYLIKGADDT